MVKKTESKNKYHEAVGRRKTAVARVRVYPSQDKEESNKITVNNKDFKTYFPRLLNQKNVYAPFQELSLNGYEVSVKVEGSGPSAQAEASRLGISRALILINKDWRSRLKASGFLKRDHRAVERKKPGLRKARRTQQWRKR